MPARMIWILSAAVLLSSEPAQAARRARKAPPPAAAETTATTHPICPTLPVSEVAKRAAAALAARASRSTSGTGDAAARFLSRLSRLGAPYPVEQDGRTVKFLLPALYREPRGREDRVAGFVHVDPCSAAVLAWPAWKPGAVPLLAWSEREARARLDAQRSLALPPPAVEALYRPRIVAGAPEALTGVFLIRGHDQVPPKNQDPTRAAVAELNASGRLHRPLRYDEAALEPPARSVPAAAASCADWWRARLGEPELLHMSLLSGIEQAGIDPRELDVRYQSRGLPMVPTALLRDPVTAEPVPLGLEGFCKLLTDDASGMVAEPLERPGIAPATSYAFGPGRYGMEAAYVEILSREMRDAHAESENAARIDRALRNHGVLLARVDSVGRGRRVYALHGIAIFGRVDLDGRPHVLFREIHGDRGLDFPRTGTAGPVLKAVPVASVYSAYAFPHTVRVSLAATPSKGQYDLRALNGRGRPVDVDALEVRLEGAVSAGVSLGGRTPQGLSAIWKAPGLYRITVPRAALADASSRLIVAADAEHFRDTAGKPCTESFLLASLPPAR